MPPIVSDPVADPEVSVVVPSHGRRLRLLWLLNALEEQSLEACRFEVIVSHAYDDERTLEMLRRHPLATSGRLREVRISVAGSGAAAKRNLGWRAARAATVAFTDDDCRPEEDWLAELTAAAYAAPGGAVVQGRTGPDPLETDLYSAPRHRTLHVVPPSRVGQTCNIAYPRALLEELGGFDERLQSGEDTDLAMRALGSGAELVPAPNAVVSHAIEAFSLPDALRGTTRWGDLPLVLRKHPELHDEYFSRWFWRRRHRDVLLAAAGIALARRRPWTLVAAAPYLVDGLTARGRSPRRVLAAAVELPGRVTLDLAEVAVLVRGSFRHGRVLL